MKKAKLTRRIIIYALLLAGLVWVVFGWSDNIRKAFPVKYEEYITNYSEENGLDPYMVYAIIRTESSFDPDAKSSAGAGGLMQLMPSTAIWVAQMNGIEDFDETSILEPEMNIKIGCLYLKYLSDKFGGNTVNILAAYNGGENNVLKWLENKAYSKDGENLDTIPFNETKNYVRKVKTAHEIYIGIYKKD